MPDGREAGAASPDARLASRFTAEWVPGATLTRLVAMNSSAWIVARGAERFVMKIAAPSDGPGLHVAACLAERGVETGAPARMAEAEGRLVALLRYVDGTPLTAEDADAIGVALGRVHRAVRDCESPRGIDRWPWPWPDTSLIADASLRLAARAAVEEANGLAGGVTHGLLHGDPAPEAFLATSTSMAIIDWGSSAHGPFLYDVASAVMYSGPRILPAYESAGPLAPAELANMAVFLRLRWAVQASYFSSRIGRGDLTGFDDPSENRKGLDDARRALLGESTGTRVAVAHPRRRRSGRA